jgi:hypothetical protein
MPSDEEAEKYAKEDLVGPKADRSCTDVIFLLTFIGFWVGIIVIAAFSLQHGDVDLLLNGYDSFVNVCGKDNTGVSIANLNETQSSYPNMKLDMTNFKYNYFTNPRSYTDFMVMCVKSCPTAANQKDALLGTDVPEFCYGPSANNTYTNPSALSPNKYEGMNANSGKCAGTLPTQAGQPTSVYQADTVLFNRCIPVSSEYLGLLVDSLGSISALTDAMSEVANNWDKILYMSCAAVGISILMVFLMRLIVKPMVYLTLLGGTVTLIVVTVYFQNAYTQLAEEKAVANAATPPQPFLESKQQNLDFFNAGRYILFIVTLIIVILLISMRNRIRLVVALFQESALVLQSIPLLLFLPIFTFVILAGFLVFWLYVFIGLGSSGERTYNEVSGFVDLKDRANYESMWWYHLFALFWVTQFLLACQQMVMAGASVLWYFSPKEEKASCCNNGMVKSSLWNLVRYHLGSVAFGSLIIAIIQMIRFVLAYIEKKTAKSTSTWVRWLLRCLQCCMWCFEKCMKFINKNAYIEIAIYGFNFCSAAKKAFGTLLANVLRVAALNIIGAFVLFMIKVFVMAIVGTITIQLFWDDNENNETFFGLIVLLIIVIAYFIADCFVDTYETVVDTMLLCFCEDAARDSDEKFASKRLIRFMGKSATIKQASDEQKKAVKEAEEASKESSH